MRLIAENVSVWRGGREVIRALSFAAGAGSGVILTGRNGAGKTTLIRVLAGFIRPESGRVRLEGGKADASLGEQCHLIGHGNGLRSSLTVRENTRFWAEFLAGEASSAMVEQALGRLGLADLAEIPAGYLSAGQRRRLALARLLVAARPIWLLDEPTSSLDTASQEIVARLMAEHLAGGGLIVAATHLPLAVAGLDEVRLDQRVPA